MICLFVDHPWALVRPRRSQGTRKVVRSGLVVWYRERELIASALSAQGIVSEEAGQCKLRSVTVPCTLPVVVLSGVEEGTNRYACLDEVGAWDPWKRRLCFGIG